ncbi:MAG: hypothetical protein PHT02_00820 [Tissierellia bacterium]|nr:hypothetical protein [Tissierellia bacterium]
MKLKCIDGKVRNFLIPKENLFGKLDEAQCLECGEYFGCKNTKNLKPLFKEHVCNNEKSK